MIMVSLLSISSDFKKDYQLEKITFFTIYRGTCDFRRGDLREFMIQGPFE